MIQVVTYLRNRNGEFSQLTDGLQSPVNSRFIEGAIDLKIDDIQILDTSMWDYVDQVWSYICDMLIKLRKYGEASTLFPDQPISLKFERCYENQVMVILEVDPDVRHVASVSESELTDALQVAGIGFFRIMSELVPGNSALYSILISRLSSLLLSLFQVR